MSTEEGSITIEGRKLYTKTWKAEGTPKARLAFIHGFSDHCNAYGALFPTLASRGIEVCSFDQAGWGRSVTKPAEKGLTGPTTRVLADIDAFLQSLLPSDVPFFLMGHSMGGGQVLHYAASGPSKTKSHIRGYILNAPFVAVHPSTRPAKPVVVIGRLAGKLLPHRQMKNVIAAELLSRDPVVQKEFVEDELCHDTGTLEGLAGMLDRAGALEKGDVVVREGAGEGGKTRIWISHGTKDEVCDFEATKKLYEKLEVEDKECKWYDGWYHKLHAEPAPDNLTYANDVAEWILKRVDINVSSQPAAASEAAKL